MILELIALSAACLLVGLILGMVIAQRRERPPAAPVPDFDATNPINGRARIESHGGAIWTVYGGR